MSRILLATAALLLASGGLASARDLVPGSDLAVREAQAAADHSVIAGAIAPRDGKGTLYGYQGGRTVRFESYEPSQQADERITPTANVSGFERAIVPGSDSF